MCVYPRVEPEKLVATTDVHVPKAPPSTTKGNVSVPPGPYWWITNVNPSFVPVRDPITPAPTSMAIAAAPAAMKTEVRAGPVCVKTIAPAERFILIMPTKITTGAKIQI